jgi:outer membrane protein insertion porin family
MPAPARHRQLLRRAAKLFLALLFLAGNEAFAQEVKEIRVVARDRTAINDEVVRAFISLETGQALSRDALARDIRAIEQSGRFSYAATDVQPGFDGWVVTYIVELKPRIRRITVDGARHISNRKVRELLELGPGDPVDDAALSSKSRAVRDFYRKKLYPFAELSWTIDVDPSTGSADVLVQVEEGPRTKVKRISFTGNDNLPASDLRKIMQQKKRGWFSWITSTGAYDPDLLSADRVLLRRTYTARGYLDAVIGEPELRELDDARVEIIIPVNEGEQYLFGDISIEGVTIFSPDDILNTIGPRRGSMASSVAIQEVTRIARDYYGSRGYIDTTVSYRLDPDPVASGQVGQPVVDVLLQVTEGHLAYISDVRFRGNTKTRDKVLRREVSVFPGEVVNQVKIRSSERRLLNLNYYSSVNAATEATPDPEKYDVVFDLAEKSTGQFLAGAGFSSIDNLIGFVELQQGNFDIANWPPEGGGQRLRLRATAGTRRTDLEMSLTEPWFLDRRLSLSGSVFRRDARYLSDEYDRTTTGGRLSLGFPVGTFTRLNLIYGLERIEIYDVDENASDIIKAEEGDRLKSSFTTELVFDSRDNFFVATRGTRAILSAMVAGGPLQGDTDIYTLEASISQYFPLWFDHVLNIRGMIAGTDYYGDSDRVPIFDRLFLGGPRNMRGFKFQDVGPKDEDGEPIGGYSMWYAMAEYTVPVAPQIRLAAFYDIGMVYNESFDYEFSEYNSDVGFGVRFDIPGFPLRFDYAWPLEADAFNDRSSGLFQFSIGYSF